MRWPWQRRPPREPEIEAWNVPTSLIPREPGKDVRLFHACPVCGAVYATDVAGRGVWLSPSQWHVHCPNGHRGDAQIEDLFYIDGTRPRTWTP